MAPGGAHGGREVDLTQAELREYGRENVLVDQHVLPLFGLRIRLCNFEFRYVQLGE